MCKKIKKCSFWIIYYSEFLITHFFFTIDRYWFIPGDKLEKPVVFLCLFVVIFK